jgi:hypothetical protein
MIKTFVEKLISEARSEFAPSLEQAFADRFDGKKIDTQWNIIHMCHVSTPEWIDDPIDEKSGHAFEFTPEMLSFIAGYEQAWLKLSSLIADKS